MRFAQKLDLPDAVDDHIAAAKIRKISGAESDAVRQIRCGIAQILYFARELLHIFVDKYQLVRNTLHGERVGNMRADMA